MLGPRELTGKILSQFYISQLPANMLSLGVSLSCRLTEQDRWDDAPYVYEQCIFMIAQMHKRTAAPAVMVTINLAGEVVIPIIPVAVAEYKRDKRDRSGAGKSGSGRGGGRGGSGGGGGDRGGDRDKRVQVQRTVRLPLGKMCEKGFCNFSHTGPCWRDPDFSGPLPMVDSNTTMALRIMEGRKEMADKKGKKCVTMYGTDMTKIVTIEGLRAKLGMAAAALAIKKAEDPYDISGWGMPPGLHMVTAQPSTAAGAAAAAAAAAKRRPRSRTK